ncbi:caspase [Microvirga tunisiensis]|uniref:Caspase n=1 Tax=Pannonibacter tanglangensis TaxID=2750084 RepID=A0A7X5J935_9HYPH|nr:caspase family protein [Pannonibacter sp. XCT-53]NBN78106.1 caspase [Pannonibacter sp. XCT-53]
MIARALAVLILLVAGASPALAKRVALVMGNGAYAHAVPLPNPANDARAMTAKLRELGFEVVAGYDLDYAAMRRTVADFARQARGAEIALLFYAGHGMQVGGVNYLIPIDAKFADETALDFETISADFVLRQMSNDVKVRMVFLDACRDNPLARTLARSMSPSRSAAVGLGLAEIKMEDSGAEGSVIAFATSPGDVALDGAGSNSPFTTALLRHLDAPDTPIQNVMTRVTGDVYRDTGERQRPWVNASLIGEVYLNRSTGTAAVAATPEQAPAAVSGSVPAAASQIAWEKEKALWDAAQAAGTAGDYAAYLAAYPGGTFAEVARNQINRLSGSTSVAETTRTETPAAPAETAAAAASAPAAGTALVADPAADQAAGGEAEVEVAALGDGNSAPRKAPAAEAGGDDQAWSQTRRREVQFRLNLAGYDVGRPDGAFGTRTRAGIRAWQEAQGEIPTGTLTDAQYAMLVEETEEAFLAATERFRVEQGERRDARSAPRQLPDQGAPLPPAEDGAGIGADGAAFIGGVIGGVLGGALGR